MIESEKWLQEKSHLHNNFFAKCANNYEKKMSELNYRPFNNDFNCSEISSLKLFPQEHLSEISSLGMLSDIHLYKCPQNSETYLNLSKKSESENNTLSDNCETFISENYEDDFESSDCENTISLSKSDEELFKKETALSHPIQDQNYDNEKTGSDSIIRDLKSFSPIPSCSDNDISTKSQSYEDLTMRSESHQSTISSLNNEAEPLDSDEIYSSQHTSITDNLSSETVELPNQVIEMVVENIPLASKKKYHFKDLKQRINSNNELFNLTTANSNFEIVENLNKSNIKTDGITINTLNKGCTTSPIGSIKINDLAETCNAASYNTFTKTDNKAINHFISKVCNTASQIPSKKVDEAVNHIRIEDSEAFSQNSSIKTDNKTINHITNEACSTSSQNSSTKTDDVNIMECDVRNTFSQATSTISSLNDYRSIIPDLMITKAKYFDQKKDDISTSPKCDKKTDDSKHQNTNYRIPDSAPFQAKMSVDNQVENILEKHRKTLQKIRERNQVAIDSMINDWSEQNSMKNSMLILKKIHTSKTNEDIYNKIQSTNVYNKSNEPSLNIMKKEVQQYKLVENKTSSNQLSKSEKNILENNIWTSNKVNISKSANSPLNQSLPSDKLEKNETNSDIEVTIKNFKRNNLNNQTYSEIKNSNSQNKLNVTVKNSKKRDEKIAKQKADTMNVKKYMVNKNATSIENKKSKPSEKTDFKKSTEKKDSKDKKKHSKQKLIDSSEKIFNEQKAKNSKSFERKKEKSQIGPNNLAKINKIFKKLYVPEPLAKNTPNIFTKSCTLSPNVEIKKSSMPQILRQHAISCAQKALKDGLTNQKIATVIKTELDLTHGPNWQCIVGTDFGSKITYLSNQFIFFFIDNIGFLIFKASRIMSGRPFSIGLSTK